ncbi:MAG: YjgP/YjgQ family permease [Calditrichaceae bacterium]|nr:LptF/LptG family permease [Calditrichia bacterium]NUQ40034.1 YjgP/YjgQ family permease [Calditrichaceae bacterium]
MKIISRYIVKEHTGPFLFSLAVIMFVFVTKFIVQYIGKLFGKGLSLATILEFVYLNLAWMLALAVPMSVLVAALMAFGRLSADNEITVLKTSGINLYRIVRPALIWAAALTIAMIWYNDQVLPEYNHRARLLFRSISQKKPTLELEEGIYLKLNNFNLLVQEIQKPIQKELADKSNVLDPNYANNSADKLKKITIFDFSQAQLQRTVIADHGYLVFDRERAQLVFTLFEGEIHEVNTQDYSEYRRLNFTRNVFYIPAEDLIFKRVEDLQRGDREMNIRMMNEQVNNYRREIARADSTIRAETANFLIPPETIAARLAGAKGKKREMNVSEKYQAVSRASHKVQAAAQKISSTASNKNYFEKQIYKYQVEIHKKFSIPFACIVFVLIGAPLGIRARKGSLGVGISFSIGFFLLYWTCLIGGEELADRQLLAPFLAMWFANILVGAFGIYLTVRTVRETRFIQWERLPKVLQFFFRTGE